MRSTAFSSTRSGKRPSSTLPAVTSFKPPGVAGVLVIDFLVELAAGELHLAGVDDDDMVAAIDVRGEARLVLAAQDVGDDRRQAADDQPVGIDQMPFLLDLSRLDRLGGLHQRLHGVDLSF